MTWLWKPRAALGRSHWYLTAPQTEPLVTISPPRVALCGVAIRGPALVAHDPPTTAEPPRCATCLEIARRRRAVLATSPAAEEMSQ